MLPTAGSSDTVSVVIAPMYLSKSPEYPPTSWKAVWAPVPESCLGPTCQGCAMSLPQGGDPLCPQPRCRPLLAVPPTVTGEDEGPRDDDKGLHRVCVHQRC